MAGGQLREVDELWAHKRASRHGYTILGNEKPETSTIPPTFPVSRLAEEGHGNRGNYAVHVSAIHSMQRIHGNRAVQRSLSNRQAGYGQLASPVPTVPVQRQNGGGYYEGDCYVGPSGSRVCGGPIQVDDGPSAGGGHYEGDCYVGPSGSRVCGGPVQVDDGGSSSGGYYEGDCYIGPNGSRVCGGPIQVDGDEGSTPSQAPQPLSPAVEMPPLEVTPGREQSWWDRMIDWF